MATTASGKRLTNPLRHHAGGIIDMGRAIAKPDLGGAAYFDWQAGQARRAVLSSYGSGSGLSDRRDDSNLGG